MPSEEPSVVTHRPRSGRTTTMQQYIEKVALFSVSATSGESIMMRTTGAKGFCSDLDHVHCAVLHRARQWLSSSVRQRHSCQYLDRASSHFEPNKRQKSKSSQAAARSRRHVTHKLRIAQPNVLFSPNTAFHGIFNQKHEHSPRRMLRLTFIMAFLSDFARCTSINRSRNDSGPSATMLSTDTTKSPTCTPAACNVTRLRD